MIGLFKEYESLKELSSRDQYEEGRLSGLKWVIDSYFSKDYEEYLALTKAIRIAIEDAWGGWDEYGEYPDCCEVIPGLYFETGKEVFYIDKGGESLTEITSQQAVLEVEDYWTIKDQDRYWNPENCDWSPWLKNSLVQIYPEWKADFIIASLKGE